MLGELRPAGLFHQPGPSACSSAEPPLMALSPKHPARMRREPLGEGLSVLRGDDQHPVAQPYDHLVSHNQT
jgi:hypothetical protein